MAFEKFMGKIKEICKKNVLVILIINLIFIIANFFIMGYFSYKYNVLLERLNYKPDMEVEISPFLSEKPFGEYLPMIITNTGDFTFQNIHIGIKSYGTDGYETYSLPILPSHTDRELPFGNIKMVESFKKINCYPFLKDKVSISISYNIGNSEEVSSSGNVCGVCYFDVKVFAIYNDSGQIKNYSKNISSQFPCPIELNISISPE